MKIDENDKAKVILTDAGANAINNYNSFLNKWVSDSMHFKTDYKEDDEFESELHTIMRIFYGDNHGTDKMFKEIDVHTRINSDSHESVK